MGIGPASEKWVAIGLFRVVDPTKKRIHNSNHNNN